jgi:hypothetical protein
VELYERIRHDHARGVRSIRLLAREPRCHRREVRPAATCPVGSARGRRRTTGPADGDQIMWFTKRGPLIGIG